MIILIVALFTIREIRVDARRCLRTRSDALFSHGGGGSGGSSDGGSGGGTRSSHHVTHGKQQSELLFTEAG